MGKETFASAQVLTELLAREGSSRASCAAYFTNCFRPLASRSSIGSFGTGRHVLRLPPALDELLVIDRPEPTAVRSGLVDALVQRGTAREQDAALRLAVEQRAVQVASAWYRERGWTVTEYGKPFDLLVENDHGSHTVEVKGSRSRIDKVTVTRNEVRNARTEAADLVVVDEITYYRDAHDRIVTDGGRLRRWAGWRPSDDELTPMTFECQLPEGPQQND
ncbi:protein NO VEIN domain-containing protein [Actinomadura coerulea]|uniref:protein NO VEIN domain-containing protein n=1 Tax=Actinomadura coerulea TaxID=46159 RepID=UPI003424B97C